MTKNQLEYWKLLETRRSNQAQERETHRSNVTRERETYRSNAAKEALEVASQFELARSNRAKEDETNRANVAKEAETSRSNLVKEAETRRSNIANEILHAQQLAETERSNKAKESETSRHNVALEELQGGELRVKEGTLQETKLQNLATNVWRDDQLSLDRDNLQLEYDKLAETNRHNLAAEAIGKADTIGGIVTDGFAAASKLGDTIQKTVYTAKQLIQQKKKKFINEVKPSKKKKK